VASNNITQVVDAGLCVQCGVCESACTLPGAVCMQWHSHEGWLPSVDHSLCSACGFCLQICPGLAVEFEDLSRDFLDGPHDDTLIGRYAACYAGFARQEAIRVRSTSGGAVTALLLSALATGRIDGAVVVRMDPQHALRSQVYLARTEAEIRAAAGTKYCTAPVGAMIRNLLSLDGKYAVVGLPCVIHSLRKLQKISRRYREKIPLVIGLFCGKNFLGGALMGVVKQQGIQPDEVADIQYRADGWPGFLRIRTVNGQTCRVPYGDYYDGSVFRSWAMPRCCLCTDGVAELADIACGDAWLPRFRTGDQRGTSVIVARTSAAARLLDDAGDELLCIEPLTADEVKSSQLSMLHRKKRQVVVHLGIRRLLGDRFPKYQQKLLRPRAVDFLRFLVSLLPARSVAGLRRLRSAARRTRVFVSNHFGRVFARDGH